MLFFFLLIFSSKFFTLNLSYHWDETNYVYYAKYFSIYGFLSIPPRHDGHVPLFSWILAIFYRVFGESPFLSHLIVLSFSFLSLYFTFLFAKQLFNKEIGIIASILLFFSPIFFSISGQSLLDIPLVAFSMMTLYFFIKKNRLFYLLSAFCLVLTKEPGIILILALVVYKFFKKDKFFVTLFYMIPVLIFFVWETWYYTQTGYFGGEMKNLLISHIFPNNGLMSLSTILKQFLAVIYQITFWNYEWILTFTIIFAVLTHKKFFNSNVKFLLILILFYVIFFSFAPLLPRYLLPIYPIFFIISAKSLYSMGKGRWVIFIIIIILFISCYRWNWGLKGLIQDPVFHSTIFYPKIITSVRNGELSLDYMDIVELEKSACDFIFTNYKNSTMSSDFPFILTRNIGIIDISDRQWIKNNITVLYPINEENIKKSNLVVIESYSGWYNENEAKFSGILSKLEIIKKFEKNGKFLIIYKGGN
jgi:hypothetical protein